MTVPLGTNLYSQTASAMSVGLLVRGNVLDPPLVIIVLWTRKLSQGHSCQVVG